MNTKAKGEISSGAVMARLMKHGYSVLLPLSDNKRYDLVIENGKGFCTVQCKTARLAHDGSVLLFNTYSSHFKTHKRSNYVGQVDFFGVYSPQLDRVFVVPVGEVAETQGSLRVKPVTKKVRATNRWASDYELL